MIFSKIRLRAIISSLLIPIVLANVCFSVPTPVDTPALTSGLIAIYNYLQTF